MRNMNREVFNLVTIKNGKADNAAIMGIFSEMAAGNLQNDISVLNYHNEMPVSYSAAITGVTEDSIDLKVHPNQALIIKEAKHTLIKSQYFNNNLSVHCFAAQAKVASGTVVLHNFAYAQIRAERREALRVTSNVPLPVIYSYDDVMVKGQLIDISLSGMSVVFDCLSEIPPNRPGELLLTLMGVPLQVQATFIKSIEGDKEVESIFTLILDRESENVISKYVYQRQVEIINELRENVDLSR
jgi:hypothetical protein